MSGSSWVPTHMMVLIFLLDEGDELVAVGEAFEGGRGEHEDADVLGGEGVGELVDEVFGVGEGFGFFRRGR
ncbi:hypothetical protein GCM10020000_74630 [Streptomyces olivoverticillatus]